MSAWRLLAMALPAAIVVAGAEGAACPNATGKLQMLSNMMPRCFTNCPRICDGMQAMTDAYMSTLDSADMFKAVCINKTLWMCAYEGEAAAPCGRVINVVANYGIVLPKSKAEIEELCDNISARVDVNVTIPGDDSGGSGGGGPFPDDTDADTDDGAGSGPSPDTSTNPGEEVSAAAAVVTVAVPLLLALQLLAAALSPE